MMHKPHLLGLILLAGPLIGCRDRPPATEMPSAVSVAGFEPFTVKENDGIRHELYRNVSIEWFLKQLPSNSLDALNVNLDGGPQVFALVKVPKQPGLDLTKVRLQTTFQTQDGETIEQLWDAADSNTTGNVTALFCLPPTVVGGKTTIVQQGK